MEKYDGTAFIFHYRKYGVIRVSPKNEETFINLLLDKKSDIQLEGVSFKV